MSSIYNSPPTHVVVAHPRYCHLNNLVDLFGFIFLAFFFLQIIFDLGDGGSIVGMGFFRLCDEFVVGFNNDWGEFFQGVRWVCCGFQRWISGGFVDYDFFKLIGYVVVGGG